MLRDYLLEWCREKIEDSPSGCCGHHCDNQEYCEHDCKKCLDQVHRYPFELGRPDYTCSNLLLRYVLHFTDRYSRQIASALDLIDHSSYSQFNIFSIGCGGTPDLMAFEEVTEKPIYYKGYDRNTFWHEIHSVIEQYADEIAGFDVKLRRQDIFDVLSLGKPKSKQYNVVVIQYLLSHLYNTEQENQTIQLFRGIINNIIARRLPNSPFLIIITDIDSRFKGRGDWYRFLDILEDAGYHGHAYAKSAFPTGDLGRERWSRHKQSKCFGNIEYTYIQNYSEHDGAQLIIELR